ncbi:MAG TPA: hypothetical protein VNO70_00965 [Blastocatellia bacterium]|nr:hypothetical protein [Blastocatellia bacterium]
MASFARAPYPVPGTGESATPQLSEQDMEKIQEIHELINLLLKEMPVIAQMSARSYVTPMLPAVPYTYSFFQFPWGRIPFVPPQGV